VIRFRQIAIQGFKSFGKDTVWRLPRQADGFYLVKGENRIEPDLGANGVGKTSLFSAFIWVITGKTERGTKASAVSNRSGEHVTSVCLEFDFGDDKALWALTRTWNPNSLSLDEPGKAPRVVSQEELIKLFGISYEGLLLTLIFGQFNQFFFDLGPAEKLAVLSEFLELGVWTAAADRARATLAQEEKASQGFETKRARLAGEVEALRCAVAEAQERAQAFEEEQKTRVKRLQEERRSTTAGLETLKVDFTRACEAQELAEKRRGDANRALLEADKQREAQRKLRTSLQVKIEAPNARLNDLSDQINAIDTLEGVCPTCAQPVSARHRDSVKKPLLDRQAELQAERQELARSLDAAQVACERCDKQISTRAEELDAADRALRPKLEAQSRLGSQVSAAKAALVSLERRLEELDAQANPHTETARAAQERLDGLGSGIRALDDSLRTSAQARAEAEFWVTGFRDVRLWVVEQALRELELHVNNALVELGLFGHQIKLEIERPKADGSGVIRGFNVSIFAPGFEEPVPWESWSGGEAQRLRLASAVGLSDLICARTGFSPSFEVWDEPTAHLSNEGIADLLSLLAQRARARQRQVFLIDHRTLNAGDFDDELRVIKDADGSRIETGSKTPTPQRPRIQLSRDEPARSTQRSR
jgi:DNA repair exonuclease SbcCD ATPase subunit